MIKQKSHVLHNPITQVQKATRAFYYTTQEEQQEAEKVQIASYTMQEKLNTERIREIRSKFRTRKLLTTVFMILLFIQNIVVFFIVYEAFVQNKLKDLEVIFTTLTGATLTETYFVIRIIVNYMFKDEDYIYKAPPGEKSSGES